MGNEFEGTKLGEGNESSLETKAEEVKTSISGEALGFSLRGTSLGEESAFEKSLKSSLSDELPKKESTRVIAIDESKKETTTEEVATNNEADTAVESVETTGTVEDVMETPAEAVSEETAVLKEEEETSELVVKVEAAPKKPISDNFEDNIDEMYGMALQSYSEGDIIQGTVLTIEKAGLFVDIRYKCEGFVSNEELGNNISEEKANLNEGDNLPLFILKLETKEGYTLLSKKRADWEMTWKEAYQSYKLKEPKNVNVINTVKGGLVVNYKGLRGFIPSSLVRRSKSTPLTDFINQTIPAVFIEVDKKRKKIILSNKVPNEAELKNEENQLEKLEVGQVVQGKVTSIKDFGAFVNINGIEGLIHISELSWDRIEKVEDILTVGESIDVFILGVDKENRKISLGRKQLTPDPWETVEEIYPIGKIVKGTVSRITTFGAFFKLNKGLEGLIHISELSHEHVKKVEDVVSVAAELEVKVIRINPEQQKIGLSLKQMTADPDSEEIDTNKEVLYTTEASSNETTDETKKTEEIVDATAATDQEDPVTEIND